MKTLDEIKNELSEGFYQCSFKQAITFIPMWQIVELLDLSARQYATEAIKEASEIAEAYVYSSKETNGVIVAKIDKDSILNIANYL